MTNEKPYEECLLDCRDDSHNPKCKAELALEPACLPECHPGGYLHAVACPKAAWNQDAKEEERE